MDKGATRDRRLSEEARRLADDPIHIAFARRVAEGWIRKLPGLRDEIESAALLGLCEAARSFDPGRGLKFRTHAQNRIVGAIKDDLRNSGVIRGRRHTHAPKVESLDTVIPGGEGRVTFAGARIESGEHPVGWEMHSEDGIAEITKGLPTRSRRAIRLFYGDCRTTTMKQVGALMGVSESRVSQVIAGGIDMIRGIDGVATMVAEQGDDEADEPTPSRKSTFRGVTRMGANGRWQAQISIRGKYTVLGYFDDPVDAARAYDRARVATPFAGKVEPSLNFPDEHPADWLAGCREMGREQVVAASSASAHVAGPAETNSVVPAAVPALALAPPAPMPPQSSRPIADDREIAAIVGVSAALRGLSGPEAGRVLRWAADRYASAEVTS